MREFSQQLKNIMQIRNISQSELCEITGISKSALSQYLSGAFKPKQERTYLLAKALRTTPEYLMGLTDDPEVSPTITGNNLEVVPPPDAMVRIPVIGRVAAGLQCFADMQIDEYAPCDASLLHTGYDYVYLRVTGDSMEPELHEGDKVLVQVRDTVESGDYAVVIVDGDDGLVKKVEYTKTQLTLISENPYYPPRRFQRGEMNRVRIFGKVVGLSRSF